MERSARFGFSERDEKPIRAYRCKTCGFIIRARYQPLPWHGRGHECRYVEVVPVSSSKEVEDAEGSKQADLRWDR